MATSTEGETGTAAKPGSSGSSDRSRLASVGAGAADAYRTARERTATAYEEARAGALTAGRKTLDGIEANPVAAVVGGLALGALAAALLPKTRREEELLGDVGRRLNETARDAARTATERGREQIVDLGLNREGVRRKLDEFTDRAIGAVTAKGKAGGTKKDK
ncbi:MAG TPA: hypothetical protein VIT45_13185 [Allosphingosinicella sp.]